MSQGMATFSSQRRWPGSLYPRSSERGGFAGTVIQPVCPTDETCHDPQGSFAA